MINKQGLWFLTLFSLILVLSVYYITMPNDMFKANPVVKENNDTVSVVKEEASIVSALKVELQTSRDKQKQDLEEVMNNNKSSAEEKNHAYEELKELNAIRGVEENLEKKIRTSLNLNTFIKVEGNLISVVVEKKEHDIKLANEIMRLIQEEYDVQVTVSVKFRV